jgi:hypothetical protein
MADKTEMLSIMICRKCTESREQTNRVMVGLVDHYTLRLWCTRHDMLITDFTLATPITPYCEICDAEVGPDHKH